MCNNCEDINKKQFNKFFYKDYKYHFIIYRNIKILQKSKKIFLYLTSKNKHL